jgi:hypothetical protein
MSAQPNIVIRALVARIYPLRRHDTVRAPQPVDARVGARA